MEKIVIIQRLVYRGLNTGFVLVSCAKSCEVSLSWTMSDKLCLKWSDFRENITTSFDGLRNDTNLSDVTLACEDGEQFEAHKVILAASSPFFQNLLRNNKQPHPMIYLKGVKSEDLVAIIDFLYCGEVNIFQENLEVFMLTAEELKINGLTGSIGENEKEKFFNSSISGKMKTKLPPKNIETESLWKGGNSFQHHGPHRGDTLGGSLSPLHILW